jgi:hypothetical protein
MSRTREKRPWLAALLALVTPGLGHLYLREWVRAFLWFGLLISTALLFIPDSVFQAEMTIQGLLRASRQVPPQANLALLGVTALSMADAYWMATKDNRRRAMQRGETCPHCGKEIEDPELDFCHWCTEPLDTLEET